MLFLHRFSRAMVHERRREQTFEKVASTAELEQISGAKDWKLATDLERSIQVQAAEKESEGAC